MHWQATWPPIREMNLTTHRVSVVNPLEYGSMYVRDDRSSRRHCHLEAIAHLVTLMGR